MFTHIRLPSQPAQQRGFTLIEMSLVLVLMAMAISTFIMLQSQQAQDNRARAVAQAYRQINQAVTAYMQTYYTVLVDDNKVSSYCADPYWRAGSSGSTKSNGCAVNLTLNTGATVRVDNGLQPTPNELARLGFLPGGNAYVDVLALPTLSAGKTSYNDMPGVDFLVRDSQGPLAERYMVLIQKICVNGGNYGAYRVPGSCTAGSVDLRGWVFNSQPYNVDLGSSSSGLLDGALRELGGDGYLSGPYTTDAAKLDMNELRTLATSPDPKQTNFTRNSAGYGAPYILAIRSGYGSASWSLFKQQIDALQTQVNNLNASVNNQAAGINSLNTTVNNLSNSFSSLNTTVSNLSSSVSSLNTTVANLSNSGASEYVHLKIHPCFAGDLEIKYNTYLNKVKKDAFFSASGATCQFGSYGSGEGWVVTDLPYDSWMPVLQDGQWFDWGFKTGYVSRKGRNVWAFWMYGQQNGGWLQYAHFNFVRTGTDTTQTDKIEGFRFGQNPGMTETGQYWWVNYGRWP